MSFDLLSEPIRKFIRDKGWEQLRPIQNAAIEKILASDNHFILASRTASGKTEAAFLPILSKINFNKTGVQVLYISPLIALINDQFYRIEEILNYLLETDLLEKLQHEVIIGIEGEKIVNSRDFYSVFKTEENYKVVKAGNTIGEIPFSPQIIEDENILLSAKIWKIKFIDNKARKIEVIPANDGKKPMFLGGEVAIHPRIRKKMLEILCSKIEYDFLDQPSCDAIEVLRQDFSVFNIRNIETDRPLLVTDKHIQLFTFTGTRINRTIQLLLNIVGIGNTSHENSSSFDIEVSKQELFSKWNSLSYPLIKINTHISTLLREKPALLDSSKWGAYLPEKYKIKLVRNKYYDIEQTGKLLATMRLVENK